MHSTAVLAKEATSLDRHRAGILFCRFRRLRALALTAAIASESATGDASGSTGGPRTTAIREKGQARAKPSHDREKILPHETAAPIGTIVPVSLFAVQPAPALATPRGPRGPSTANARSCPSLPRLRSAATAREAPREDEPRTSEKPSARSTPASHAPSADRLTRTDVRLRRGHAKRENCVP